MKHQLPPAGEPDLCLFARSPAMRSVAEAIDYVAAQPGGVLLWGEPGSGRRFVARIIHSRSAFRAGPFVECECGGPGDAGERLFNAAASVECRQSGQEASSSFLAPTRSLAALEDGRRRQIAGRHQPGGNGSANGGGAERALASSGLAPDCGATLAPDSLLARARGGTLLLLNLPDMPERDQARLARLLRGGEACFGDGLAAEPINLRVIAAVDSSWDDALVEGRVRQDLNRHFSASRIFIPPLRERRDDIADLAAHFLDGVSASARLTHKVLTQPVIALLTALAYRGNVAELRLLIENLALRTPGRVVRLEALLNALEFEPRSDAKALGGTLREARARFERQYILAMLQQHKGRPGAAAEALGIQRTNLYRKMRVLGIRMRRAPTSKDIGR